MKRYWPTQAAKHRSSPGTFAVLAERLSEKALNEPHAFYVQLPEAFFQVIIRTDLDRLRREDVIIVTARRRGEPFSLSAD